MFSASLTSHIDVAQVVLYIFFIFFFGLVLHLRREDKREGYPLESDRSHRAPRTPIVGFPSMPAPKRWKMPHGEADLIAPRAPIVAPPIRGVIDADRPLLGYPLQPSGNPLHDAIGPGSYVERREVPDRTIHGLPKIAPMRLLGGYHIIKGDPDPCGLPVVAADGIVAGTVEDIWVDRAEPRILYYQVELTPEIARHKDTSPAQSSHPATPASHEPAPGAVPAGGLTAATSVLVPAGFAKVQMRHGRLKVASIPAAAFAFVPGFAKLDALTRREEDAIMAYYGGGRLFAFERGQEARL